VFKVLDIYLLKTFLKAAFASLLVFLLIYLIIDNIEHLDDYIDNDAQLGTIVRYYIHYFPFIIVQVTPVAVLLGSMFTVGLMARRNEILALNSSGVSLYRIARPLLIGGMLISIGMFFFADRVVPASNNRKTEILYNEIERKNEGGGNRVRNLYYLGAAGRIFQFADYNPSTRVAQNVQIRRVVNNRLRSQITAQRLTWKDSIWLAEDVEERVFSYDSTGVGTEALELHNELYLTQVTEQPTQFEKSEKIRRSSDKNLGFDMSLEEIRKTIENRRHAAMETTREEVYFHIKFSLPIANFIIVLLAVPLASDPRRGSLAIGFAFSAGITFIYILLFETGQKLGTEGSLPPFAAAWGVNAVFLVVGIVLMIKARK